MSQIAATVTTLRQTFDSGRTRGVTWRRKQLAALLRMFAENEEALLDAVISDHRRERSEAFVGDIAPVISGARYALKNLDSWARPRRASLPITMRPGKAWFQHEPFGVTLIIAPWNYPIHLALVPLIGAIAAGNCVVIKPSEHAPKCSAVMADLLPRYLDSEAIAVVEGEAAATVELLASNLDYCFFTGSPTIGREVMRAAAEHLTPVTLELGGKCPAIVTSNTDLKVAAQRIAFGKVMGSGQTCVAPDYVLVEKSARDELISELTQALQTLSPERTLPVIDQRHLQRLTGMLDRARDHVVSGGDADTDRVRLQPTIVLDPPADSALRTDEIFGPILPVLTVESLDEAIAHVRRDTKPLAAYLFSTRPQDEKKMLAEIDAGGVVINNVMQHLGSHELPFGGVGTSGMGAYHGRFSFETFSYRKAVLRKRNWPESRGNYPPYSEKVLNFMRKRG
jgi:aldehyde dehydrogenase (NAD+)